MKAIGAELARALGHQIELEWTVLDSATPALLNQLRVESWTAPANARLHFALVSGSDLLVGKREEARVAKVFRHPLSQILLIQDPPFPIDVGLAGTLPRNEQWIEQFSIGETQLQLEVGTSSERIANLQCKWLLLRVGLFLFLLIFVGGTIIWWLYRKLTSPLNALQLTMERVAEGAVHSRYVPKWLGFEINDIGEKFNETLDLVLEHQAEAQRERSKREQMAFELKIGREIQASLFPSHIEPFAGVHISAAYLPAKEVGGDFYDVFPMSKDSRLIAIGDVSDKGISACLYSLGLRSTLRACARSDCNLLDIARQANDLFLLDVQESGFFATLWLAVLNNEKLQYVSFGHPPALLKRNGEILELSTHGSAFGLMEQREFKIGEIELLDGDVMLLYTDGAIEAHDANQTLFGMERLKQTLQSASSASAVLKELVFFSQNTPQHDDIALLFLQK